MYHHNILIPAAAFGHVRLLTCQLLRDRKYRLLFILFLRPYYVSSGWYIDDINIETGAISFQFPETWETGLGNWNSESGTWEVGTPSTGPGNAYQGLKCAATVLNGNYYENVDSRLISPVLTVPAAGENPRLRFWHWFNIGAYDLWNGAGKSERQQSMD